MTRRRLPFTPDQVATIRELRPAGASWRAIARTIGRSHVGCRRFWIRELGGAGGWARARGRTQEVVGAPPAVSAANRPPLPAGSLESWGAITGGTAIDGSGYR